MSLLAVDLDGTLLDLEGRPHVGDVAAIRAALAAGIRVTIVTGRLYSGTRAVVEQLGLSGAVGCADGSHLVDARDHTTLLHIAVQGQSARSLRGAFERHRPATFVFARDAIGHDAAGERVQVWAYGRRKIRRRAIRTLAILIQDAD